MNSIKTVLLTSTLLSLATLAGHVSAGTQDYSSGHAYRLTLELPTQPDDLECYFDSVPIFDYGELTESGWFYQQEIIAVECSDPLANFFVTFDQSPTYNGNTIYSDPFVDVYLTLSPYDNRDDMQLNLIPDSASNATDCNDDHGTSNADSLGDPWDDDYLMIGGSHALGSSNRNVCAARKMQDIGHTRFEMEVTAILHYKQEASSGDIDQIPNHFMLPAQLTMR